MPARIASRFERSSTRCAVDRDRAAFGPAHSEDRQRELGPAGAEQAGQPERLALADGEGNILVFALPRQPGDAAAPARRRRRRVP